jgi:hypothetical protein
MPRQDRRKVSVESTLFLTQKSASSTIGPQSSGSTQFGVHVGLDFVDEVLGLGLRLRSGAILFRADCASSGILDQ